MSGPTRAGGHPDYSSGSTSNFIPAIWSGNLIKTFYKSTVWESISNTDYEGEIRNKGDKVYMRQTPVITVRDYEIGGGLTYEKPEKADVELNIDKAKYFGFEINDVDAVQSDIDLMEDWSADAAERMKIAVDADVLSGIYADAQAANKGATAGAESSGYNMGTTGSPVSVTKANVLDYIVDMGSVLDEANVPEANRWLVMPAWACGLIKKSDLKDASLAGDGTSIMRNGRMGMIDRFTLYMSNNIAKTTDGSDTVFNIIAGHPSRVTFAAQITEMETLPNMNDFGDLIRGLMVYGYKVTNGDGLVHFYAKKG